MRKPFFLLIIFLIGCSVSKNKFQTKTIKFTSTFGNFTMQMPSTSTWIEIPGEPSFDGKIAMGSGDTLYFSLGFWTSLLNRDSLTNWEDFGKYVRAKKYKNRIDGYDAYILTSADNVNNVCRVYIDSLYVNGEAVTKFELHGKGLNDENQKMFFQAIETLKFEK